MAEFKFALNSVMTKFGAMVAILMVLLSTSFAIPRVPGLGAVASAGVELSPVILVPGTGGTQIEVRLTKDYKPGSLFCYSFTSSFFRLWLDVFSLLPPFTSCFAERMKLVYNKETERFGNSPGVETRVPNWGGTQGMETLDPNLGSYAAYMGPLVSSLKKAGYVVHSTLFGAPYDFRYAPGSYAADVAVKYEQDLKQLIEHAYTKNSNRSVVLFAHSLGGLWALYFLNQQPQSWRAQFIKRFISASAPWGGTVQEMLTYASGYTEGIPLLDPLTLRLEQRTSETNLWLLPTPKVFSSRPLVLTNSRMYSAEDMEDFFKDIGYPEGVAAYKTRIPPLISNITAPGVPVSILYCRGEKTPERLFYQDSFDKQPAVMNGDGDGTVNYESLVSVIPEWQAVSGQQVRTTELCDCTHASILTDSKALKPILEEILLD